MSVALDHPFFVAVVDHENSVVMLGYVAHPRLAATNGPMPGLRVLSVKSYCGPPQKLTSDAPGIALAGLTDRLAKGASLSQAQLEGIVQKDHGFIATIAPHEMDSAILIHAVGADVIDGVAAVDRWENQRRPAFVPVIVPTP